MPQIYGKTYNGSLPGIVADGVNGQVRTGRYGEVFDLPIGNGTYAIAMEGSYYRAINPVFGTAFAPSIAASTAFSETAASFIFRNTAGAGGKDVYLDYLRIWYVTAPTGNTTLDVAVQIDNTNRTGTGGTAVTPTNVNSGIATASVCSVTAGPIASAAAGGSPRKLGLWRLKGAIPAIADEFMINFGQVSTAAQAPGTAKTVSVGPIYLPAGANHSCLVHLFGAAQSAAGTVHMDAGWWER